MDAAQTSQSAIAELSSVGSQLDDLTRRITAAAEYFESAGGEHVAHELFEVERALRTSSRRLDRAMKASRS